MNAGRLTHRLKLLTPIISEGPTGQRYTALAEGPTVWAERVKHSGADRVQAGEHYDSRRAQFRIYSAHRVKAGMQMQQVRPAGPLWEVVSVEENIVRGFITVTVDSVNE